MLYPELWNPHDWNPDPTKVRTKLWAIRIRLNSRSPPKAMSTKVALSSWLLPMVLPLHP